MPEKMTVTVRGVPLEVEFAVYPCDGVRIHEVWINGIEMVCLLDDRFICRIRDEVIRRDNAKAKLP